MLTTWATTQTIDPKREAARGEARKAGEDRPFDDYMPQRKAGVWTGASQRRFISSSSIDTVTEQPAISSDVTKFPTSDRQPLLRVVPTIGRPQRTIDEPPQAAVHRS